MPDSQSPEPQSPEPQDDFYVGYLPEAPPALGRFAKRVLMGITAIVIATALALVTTQAPYAAAVFEFGTTRSFEGVLTTFPHPMLRLERPGEADSESLFYLVQPGKFGASEAVAGLDGHRVRLEGTLIYRSDQTMLELSPEGVEDLGEGEPAPTPIDLGVWTFQGEIVDSKCFLGVMNPGNLKPHRDCATRCISGGIPPILLVRQPDGLARHLLLVGPNGEAINQEVLSYVAEPIEVHGALQRVGERLVLKADPATFTRL